MLMAVFAIIATGVYSGPSSVPEPFLFGVQFIHLQGRHIRFALREIAHWQRFLRPIPTFGISGYDLVPLRHTQTMRKDLGLRMHTLMYLFNEAVILVCHIRRAGQSKQTAFTLGKTTARPSSYINHGSPEPDSCSDTVAGLWSV